MTRRAVLRGVIKVLHHRLAVTVEMRKDLGVAHGPGDGRAILVDKYGRNTKDITARPACVHLLDRVTNAAGDALVVVPLAPRSIWRKRSTRKRNRIMASFAVARVLDPLLLLQQVRVAQIPGRPVRVGVRRLAPFRVGLFVAAPAVLRTRKALRVDQITRIGRRIRGQERMPLAEVVAIGCKGLFVVSLASSVGGFALRRCLDRPKQASRTCNNGKYQQQPEGPARVSV